MASDAGFIQYICEQIEGIGTITSRKMFGEYMVYLNAKPIFLVCDNTVFVKMHDCIAEKMQNAATGNPYNGAKLHYILDIDNADFSKEIALDLEVVTPVPKPRKKKAKE
jgi:Regulator of competence-specific genes